MRYIRVRFWCTFGALNYKKCTKSTKSYQKKNTENPLFIRIYSNLTNNRKNLKRRSHCGGREFESHMLHRISPELSFIYKGFRASFMLASSKYPAYLAFPVISGLVTFFMRPLDFSFVFYSFCPVFLLARF